MNTQHLKYVIEVERTGSITQAADNMYIGQPSLSKAIKELEDSLGIVIFKRNSKGAVPTEKGAEFLKYARTVLVQVEKMEALQRPAQPDRQEIRASIPRSSYISMAAADCAAEMNLDKGLEIEVSEVDSLQAAGSVIEGRASLGVIRYFVRDETYFADYLNAHEIRQETLWEYDRLAVFSKKHPLSDRAQLRAEMLFPYAEVILDDETVPYAPAREEKRPDLRRDKFIGVKDRMNAFEMLARVPGAYMWSEPLPEEILQRYALAQRVCPLEEGRRREALIYRKGHEFSGVEKRLINKLYEYRNKLAFQEYL